MKCKFESCDREKKSKGLCDAHYRQQKRGDKLSSIKRQFSGQKPLDERFFEVGWDFTPEGCWEWRGSKDWCGYGTIKYKERTIKAHRYSYTLSGGEDIPEGMVVRHKVCDNPPCVNPDHLLLGTQAENVEDTVTAGRASSGNPKLNPQVVREARQMLASGMKQGAVEEHFGMARGQASRILNGKIWAWVDNPDHPRYHVENERSHHD